MTTDEEIEAILSEGEPPENDERYAPLDARSLLDKATQVYKKHFGTLVGLYGLLMIPGIAVPFFFPELGMWNQVLSGILTTAALSGTVILVRRARQDQPTSVAIALQSIVPRATNLFLFVLLGAGVGMGLMYVFPLLAETSQFMAGIAGLLAFLLVFRFCLTLPLIMEEGLHPFAALIESYALTGDGSDGGFRPSYGKKLWPRILLAQFTQAFFSAIGGFAVGLGVLFVLNSMGISPEGSATGILTTFIALELVEIVLMPWIVLTPIVAYFEAKEYIAQVTPEEEELTDESPL